MKRTFFLALATIWALSLVSACKKPVPDADPSIEIKTQTILVPTGETTATFTFVANNDWTVTSSDGWCRVSPTSGKASENAAMVTITLDPNTGSDTRSAKITIKAGGIEKQITVTQAPEEVAPENIVINYIWNSQDDTQITNRQIDARYSSWGANMVQYYTAIVQMDFADPDLVLLPSDDAKDWIVLNGDIYYNEQGGTYSLYFVVKANPYNEPRTGHVRVATRDGSEKSPEITVNQAALPEHAIYLGTDVYWHEFNLGASSPEEYGDYYAWGELESKTTYTLDNYNCAGGDKYSKVDHEYGGTSYTENLWEEHDPVCQRLNTETGRYVAHWQSPYPNDIQELLDTRNSPATHKWEWKTKGGHPGWEITYLENGNSIFLPAGGYIFDGSDASGKNELGCYWSNQAFYYHQWTSAASPSDMSYYLRFEPGPDGEAAVYEDGQRAAGMLIRPVTR